MRDVSFAEGRGGLGAALGFMAAGMWIAALGQVPEPYATALTSFSMWFYIPGWLFLLADSREAVGIALPGTTQRISAPLLLGISFLIAWIVGAATMGPVALGFASVFTWLATPLLLAYLPIMYAPITIVHAWVFSSWLADAGDGGIRKAGLLGSLCLVASGGAGLVTASFLVGQGLPTGLEMVGWADRPLHVVGLISVPPILAGLGYTALTAAWGRQRPRTGARLEEEGQPQAAA